MVNLIAISLSHVTNIRWRQEQTERERIKKLWITRNGTRFFTPSNWAENHRINDGCAVRPVAASVAAKQASKMLALLRSLGLLFTAIITNTLSRTVKGQVMLLMMTVINTLTSSGSFASLPSVVIFEKLLVMFDEFEVVRLDMLKRVKSRMCQQRFRVLALFVTRPCQLANGSLFVYPKQKLAVNSMRQLLYIRRTVL